MKLFFDISSPGAGIDWFLKYVLEIERLPSAGTVTLETAEPARARVAVETDDGQQLVAELFNLTKYPAERIRLMADGEYEIVVNPGNIRIIDRPPEQPSSGGVIEAMHAPAAERPGVEAARIRAVTVDRGEPAARAGEPSLTLDEARTVVTEAYETAAEIRLEAISRAREQIAAAERQAKELQERAREEAERITAQAAAEAEITRQRGRRDAEAAVAEGRSEGDRIRRKAMDEAAGITESARLEAQEVLDSVAAALQQAQDRQAEIERLEAEFNSVAQHFIKWLGDAGQPTDKSFKGILSRLPRPRTPRPE